MNGITKLLGCCLLLAGLSAQAQMLDKKALSLAEARKIVAAATVEAKKNNWNVVIAVVDDGGHLLTLDRLDNTQRASVDIAIGKARTAAMFRRSSALLEDAVNKGRSAFLSVDALFLQGGLPILAGNEVVGGVGVSGVTSQQDEQIAKAGVDAVGK